MSDETQISEARILDRIKAPLGSIPKNTQHWVLGSLAVVIVLITWISGRSAPHKEPRPLSSTVQSASVNPTPIAIDEFVNQLDDRAKKLAEAKAALEREQKALISGNAVPMKSPTSRVDGYPSVEDRYWMPERATAVAKTPIQQEIERREFEAPGASNIAMSFRQNLPSRWPNAAANSGAQGGPKPPGLLDLLTADSMFANAVAAQLAPSAASRGTASTGTRADVFPPTGAASQPGRMFQALDNVRPDDAEKRYTLFEGSFIETALSNRIDATFSGPVICIVTTDVYSPNGQHLLIPRGSKVIGEVRQVDSVGQQRVAVAFHRLILPNERSISLDSFQGLNQVGETGLRDQVNHHYLQMFGAAAAVGAISGLAQTNTRYGADASFEDVYRQGVGSSLAQSSMRILDRFLNILPTFTIREGHRIKVYLSQDIELPEYVDEE
jgi:type IV secretion system protein VirB10